MSELTGNLTPRLFVEQWCSQYAPVAKDAMVEILQAYWQSDPPQPEPTADGLNDPGDRGPKG